MEEANLGRGFADRPQGAAFDDSLAGGRGGHRCLSALYAAAAGRLPLCLTANDPAPDAILIAAVLATSWHWPAARCRGRQAGEEEVQELPDRLLPYRYRRSTH